MLLLNKTLLRMARGLWGWICLITALKMVSLAADYLHAVCYLNNAVCGFDDTMIANLTAAFCVEGGSVKEYHNGILCLRAFCNGIVCNQSNDFCIHYGIHIIDCVSTSPISPL